MVGNFKQTFTVVPCLRNYRLDMNPQVAAPQPLPGGSTELRGAGNICYISSTRICAHAVDMKVYMKHLSLQLPSPFQGKDAAAL